MESEDASDEEASHCNPPKMDLTNNQCLEVISMLLMTATEDCLKRGSVMAIIVEFWGLPPLIPLLQCVNRLGFEICSVNSCQSEQGSWLR